jgi:flagellar biosynthesis/type III secretory pathway chaperone
VHTVSGEVVDVLNEQIRCAEAMLRTLGRENDALVAGDVEALYSAGADKTRLVESLEALETERRNLGAGVDGDTQGRGSPEWQSLLDLISACKDWNLRNGALVKARSDQVQIALQALRGSEPGFYDPSGHKASERSVRPLGTA